MPASKNRTYHPDDPVSNLPFVGPAYEERLRRLGIETLEDLILHFPFRYEDTRDISTLDEIKEQGEGTTEATIRVIGNTRTRNGRFLTKAVLEDSTGSLSAIWFNQPYLSKTLRKDDIYLFSGKISDKWGTKTLMNPKYEKVSQDLDDLTHLGKLSPVYPETHGLSSKWIRARIKPLRKYLAQITPEYLPDQILSEEKLIDRSAAIEIIHFPESVDEIRDAQRRLGLDELIEIRRQADRVFKQRQKKKSTALKSAQKSKLSLKLLKSLSFTLTSAQETALREILEDLEMSHPMYRLLNGDVGSGKTIVALLAAAALYEEGYTTIIMAPTTILAQQHYESITQILKDSELEIPVTLLTSAEKSDLPEEPGIIIGTHALIYKSKLPKNTAFIIVDEQHRFGVVQRKKLMEMTEQLGETSPHYLTMTATPIPRTLTMALYGSTGVSVLDELPEGRKTVATHVVSKKKRNDAYEWIGKKVEEGDQVFIICPLVEESDLIEATSVKEEYKRLSTEVFPNLNLGLVHGQLKEHEKNAVLDEFRDKKHQILVATPVIEVGIDIPNATVMIIEDAERFGLAQLHQLRGRIGRGEKESFCFLFTENPSEEAQERLKYFSTHSSGFDVAEYDLKRRGPGEVYGVRQSGLLNLQFADISDTKQFKQAERIAKLIESDVPSI